VAGRNLLSPGENIVEEERGQERAEKGYNEQVLAKERAFTRIFV